MYVNVFVVVGPKKEKSKYFQDLYFFKLFISILYTYMFPACFFRQRTYGAPNENRTHTNRFASRMFE